MLPNDRETDITGVMDKTVAKFMEVKNPPNRKPHCSTLEVYEETPIFILVDTTGDLVESVAQKLSGSAGPGGTDLEDLQGWLLKFGDDSNKLRISVESFVEWLANQSPPWAAYQ